MLSACGQGRSVWRHSIGQSSGRGRRPQPTPARPVEADLSDAHAYQASPRGRIERQVYDLTAVTTALVQYATIPTTRHLVANEAKDLQGAAERLRFVLQVVAEGDQP